MGPDTPRLAGRRDAVRLVSLWGPVAAHVLLVFWLSSFPQLPAPPGRLTDKQAHALAYGVLAGLLCRALAGGRLSRLTAGRALAAVLLATLYGVTDEWHQSFVPGRQSDTADLLADACGAALAGAGCFSCGIIWRFWHGRREAAR